MIGVDRFVTVAVHGWSMYPAYADGDKLLARRRSARRSRAARAGSVVVVPRPDEQHGWREHPYPSMGTDGYFVKRVLASPGDEVPGELLAAVDGRPGDRVPPGMLLIVGDHPLSRDSRQHGYCPAHLVVAVVVCRLSRSGRPVPTSVLSVFDLPQQGVGLLRSRVAE